MLSDGLSNSSVNQSFSYNPLSSHVILVYEITIGVMCGVGTVSNLLACTAVFAFHRLRNPGNIFIANMSATGVLYCGVVLPLRIVTLNNQTWVWADWVCTLFGGLAHFCAGAIAFFFGAIAANRLVHIRHPRHYFCLYGKCGLIIQVISIWFLAVLFCFILPLSGVWGRFTYQPLIYSCSLPHTGDMSYTYFLVSFGLIVPICFVTVCYIAIFVHVKRAKNRLDSWGKDRWSTVTVSGKTKVAPSVSENMSTGGASSSSRQTTNQTASIKDIDNPLNDEVTEREKSFNRNPVEDLFTAENEKTDTITEEPLQKDQLHDNISSESLPHEDPVAPATVEPEQHELPGRPASPVVEKPTSETRVRFSVVAESHTDNELAKVRDSASRSDQLNFQNRRRSRRASSQIFSPKQKKEGLRLAFMMICAFFSCLVCTVPYFVVTILEDSYNFPLGYMIAIMFVSFGIALNPFVYALMNVHYRKAYKVILVSSFRCRVNVRNSRELGLEQSCTMAD